MSKAAEVATSMFHVKHITGQTKQLPGILLPISAMPHAALDKAIPETRYTP
jgi:hypothetical protein